LFFLQPSQKRLLSSFNPLVLAALAFVACVVRSTAAPLLPESFLRWDALMPFVAFFAARRALAEGLILTLFTAHVYSLCSAAPIGVFTTHYLILFFVARALTYVVFADTWGTELGLIALLTFLARFCLPAVAWWFDVGWSVFSWQNLHPFGWALNSLGGLVVFRLLVAVDRATFKSPRTSIELAESGL
jgi:hypothetical protein